MSKLILGTVQMGLDYGVNNISGKITFENSCLILSKAFESEIDTLDTAEAYGNAHQVIGNVKAEEIEQKVKTYIKELNVDSLEVLMFHSFDSYENNKQIITVLNDLKKQGVIKHIGVSIYTNSQIETLLLDDNVTVVQMPFNLLDNESIRGELMYKLKEKGKIIHTRSAFLQGLFFKKSSDNSDIFKELSKELITIKKIAHEENTSISNLALTYCLNQEKIDQVLIGVDSESQLIENINALNYKIGQETIKKINSIKVNNTDLLNPSLWK
jgi:aryl-alcohol dehydrogenase-like predicted oxidoreductase